MSSRRALFASTGLVIGVSACLVLGHGAAQTPATPAFPVRLVTEAGEGPALYLDGSSGSPAIGYVEPGVGLEVVEAPTGSRVRVRIRGGMRVQAYLDARRLGAYVVHRGRLRGTPAYLGGSSSVRVNGFGADGRASVTASVRLGARTLEYTGTFPIAGLGAEPADARAADVAPPGTAMRLVSDRPFPLYDVPGGTVIETLPAGETPCFLVQSEGGYHSVLVGAGSYLAGYVSIAPQPLAGPLRDGAQAAAPGLVEGVPAPLLTDAHLPLVRLAAGTRVTFDGQTIAVLDQPGMARVVERHEASGEADVFVSVDGAVSVRGMVALDALGQVSASR